ncbi:bifunctional UDP-N-acetylmuramoyl-tripeptide:D-alanyl-D-alanine ligase/alanine racemase [Panacibacter ginsenosidivorans]|uniref:Alanine racemase n=1 Tax=Panacibacter ginsenosidivorans TaxID=1813871 RepID=A0A5B8V9W7_9BACT|nr:bifunctional UDP-N-acetylmuramoyl-tripeptide:D-alanyl-D-alanine ligase/alanine racemase [Panacibacter ginsenosidivorans]QEC68224.1 bifunctional UDP-N-acetylmuramoyl-tripeptide:D-alanyl-D-alanine ligase/alanine racemase [Panacibacter ginsenosidivorans]
MIYTAENIAEILCAKATLQNANAIIEHLITDSRRISFPATSLFFALQTARRDAHNFIQEVYERGVSNFVVRTGFDTGAFTNANFIFVDDTLKALQNLAARHRAQFNYPVIGITGSNGKTIVKEWLYQLLSPGYNIVRSPRSYNSQVGVPLSVWQMGEENNLAIFEAGISMPGEMAALEKIIQPTIGILTNIGDAHNEGFKDRAEKLQEKLKLFKNCKTFIGREQDLAALDISNGILTWGSSNKNTFIISGVDKRKESTQLNITYKETVLNLFIPFTDNASIENAISCACVLLQLGIDKNIIAERMRQLQPIDMRLQLIHGINNCVVINDSYSFDINSLSIGLDFLLQQQQHAQKTVIISDIPSAQNSEPYEEVAAMLQARNIERVITIGEQWNHYQQYIKDKIAVTQHYQSTASFIEHFSANHFRNEAILLKGARVFGFEKIVALLEKKVHQTVMEVNLNAIVHNLNEYRSRLNKGVKLMAMVKAFAYGSGSAEVASLLQFHKVDYLAVAYADEGVELRKAGIHLPIMVMNVDEAAFETIIENNLEPELFSLNIFNAFISFLQKNGLQQYPVHIKLDTGMHRLGFEQKDLPALLPLLKGNHYIVVQSVFSHLAASEDPNEDTFTTQQSTLFEACCAQIREVLGYHFTMHISNSAAIFRRPELQYNMVRLGIGLYGVDSSNAQQLALQTVATLKTTIAQLRTVVAGDTISYNRRGKTTRDSLIATIRIGYADGFSRRLGYGNGKVFIHGHEAPVIGTVAMDMTMVDVTSIPNIKEGDEVEIFGKYIPVQQVAKWCDTIPYEILTGINQRVKRIYLEE